MRRGHGEEESVARGFKAAGKDGLHSFSGGSSYVSGDPSNAVNKSRLESSSGEFNDGRDFISTTPWDDDRLIDNPLTIIAPTGVNTGAFAPKNPDMVNHPSHYSSDKIECIEAIQAQLTKEEYRGFLKGNVAKYIWREKHKGGAESLKKAQWYLERLVELDQSL